MVSPAEGPFARHDMATLFPTFAWSFDLKDEERDRLNASLLAALDRIAAPRPRPTNDLSLQTDHDFYETPEFKPLEARIRFAAERILEFLQVEPAPMSITGAWLNVSAGGIRHHRHAHPNNYLSGVYYVQTPRGGDSISFADPRPQAAVITPRLKKITPVNGSVVKLEARAGRILFFPSWLEHWVEPNAGTEERISLAFNLMFSDFVPAMARPQWKPKLKG